MGDLSVLSPSVPSPPVLLKTLGIAGFPSGLLSVPVQAKLLKDLLIVSASFENLLTAKSD